MAERAQQIEEMELGARRDRMADIYQMCASAMDEVHSARWLDQRNSLASGGRGAGDFMTAILCSHYFVLCSEGGLAVVYLPLCCSLCVCV